MATNDIVLSAASRSNLLSLQSTQKLIDITQLRLATGKKVNSALDNPQSFFQSQALSNRAGDLTKLLDGIGQSIRAIEEADNGITSLTKLVEQAQSVAEEAKSAALASSGFAVLTSSKDLSTVNDLVADSGGAVANGNNFLISFTRSNGTTVTSAAGSVQIDNTDNIYDLAAEINSSANISPYIQADVNNGRLTLTSLEEGGIVRITGGASAPSAAAYTFLGLDQYVGTENTLATTRQGGTVVTGKTIYSQASANATDVASTTLATAGFYDNAAVDNATVTLTVDGTAYTTAAILDTDTIQAFLDRVNGLSAGVTASWNATDRRIELTADSDVGVVDLRFTAGAATTIDFGFGTGVTDTVLANTQANSERFTFIGSDPNLTQYQTDFNKLRTQIDGIVEDANYRGTNLLSGDDLTTFFNEDRTNTLVTTGVDFTANGLGLASASFTTVSSIQLSIDQARAALDDVRNFGSSIANDLAIIQARQVFTQETINTLKAGAADLVNADLNEEGANLLALQTAQQLGVTSLSLASQSQQSVLRLF